MRFHGAFIVICLVGLGAACCTSGGDTVSGELSTPPISNVLTTVSIGTSVLPSRPPGTDCGYDSSLATQSGVGELFARLACEVAPMSVFGLSDLAPEMSIPEEWWPVLDTRSPTEYRGPIVGNPRITGDQPGEHEVQVLLRSGGGWLAILENFRGDLGETAGRAVGTVEGRPAVLYQVNGGSLVQWSDEGRWYGVFGRGLSDEEVISAAHALSVVKLGH